MTASPTVPPWLNVRRGAAPLIVSLPHAGLEIPEEIAEKLRSAWLARKDADWHTEQLYDFAADLDATVIQTAISRTVIDVNRDPSGASLYPGQATTELCPTTTFDGEPLYLVGNEPSADEIARRRVEWFDPYHAAIVTEIDRLRADHRRIVVYDCHSIRSVVPRLFEGELPVFNLGTDGGRTCDPALAASVETALDSSGMSRVTNGRFRGGYITRHYGRPDRGVHALQVEIAQRGYLDEPVGPLDESNWPPPYDPARAETARETVFEALRACLAFATSRGTHP